jgi:transposase
MLMLPPSVRVYMASGVTDLRRSVDGLSALVISSLSLDAFSGHLFLFRNRRGDRVKILVWDRSGFWVLYKRLEKGTFAWPKETPGATSVELSIGELTLLLEGVDVASTKRRRWYTRQAA